jgi:hypothetical protein
MRHALQWRLLLENPADGVKVPQQPRNEMQALTVEQARTLLNVALTTPYGPVLAVALTTGMRPSGSGFVPRRKATGFFPAHEQRCPTIPARCGNRCSRPRRHVPKFRDGSDGIRFVTAIVPGSTKTGVPLGVQQKLMRHATISTTMNVYGGAFMESKRKANSPSCSACWFKITPNSERPSLGRPLVLRLTYYWTISDHNHKSQFLVNV